MAKPKSASFSLWRVSSSNRFSAVCVGGNEEGEWSGRGGVWEEGGMRGEWEDGRGVRVEKRRGGSAKRGESVRRGWNGMGGDWNERGLEGNGAEGEEREGERRDVGEEGSGGE